MQITAARLSNMFAAIAQAMAEKKEWLCQLDGVIGDADHGIAMELGFAAAASAVGGLDLSSAEPTRRPISSPNAPSEASSR